MKLILSEEQIKQLILLESGVNGYVYNKNRLTQKALPGRSFSLDNIDQEALDAFRQMSMGGYGYDMQGGLLPQNINMNPGGWLNTVQDTYRVYTNDLFGGQYNQNWYRQFPGIGNVRADCSGFVSTCLRRKGFNVGQVNSNYMMGQQFANAIRGGFTRIPWNKQATAPDSNGHQLPPGTIFVKPGHVTVYAGGNAAWDYGGKRRRSNGSPVQGMSTLNRRYTYAFVPNTGLS